MSKVLILGGTGFIARHLVKYLLANELAEKIRVADKQLPQTSYFSEEFKRIYESERVEYMQANLSNEGMFFLVLLTMCSPRQKGFCRT